MKNNQGNRLEKENRKLRTSLGLPQYELVHRTDVSYTTLTKMETGFIKNPLVYMVVLQRS